MKTLLSIDGGGIFGVGVASWLSKFHPAWKPDYVAGTSVGSIIAALIAVGKSYKVISNMFQGDLVKRIFTKPNFPFNLLPTGYTYDNKEAKKVFQEVFGDWKLKDCKIPLIIVAWNYEKRQPKVFTHKHNQEYFIRDAVLASISAPTYFPIAEIKDEKGVVEQLGDGGVCANDPSMAAYAAMREDGLHNPDIRILSIGTSGTPKTGKIDPDTTIGWLPIIIDTLTLGNSGYSQYAMCSILGDRLMRVAQDMPKGDLDDLKLIPKIKAAWDNVSEKKAVAFVNGNPIAMDIY